MFKAYKYRLYPNPNQEVLIKKNIDSCRFLYNLALETKIRAYDINKTNLSFFALHKQLPELKKECPWLKEADSHALTQSLMDLNKSFDVFFKGNARFPNFKTKLGKKSFRNPNGNKVQIKDGKLHQPKFREGIKVIVDREFKGEIRNTTISKSSTGKYYVSVLVETGVLIPKLKPVKAKTSIGIDLGLRDFIVTSAGEKVGNPKHLKKSFSRLKYLQRQASEKVKGSNNRRKANLKVALTHEKITNQRKDFLHKLSTTIVKNHDTLCLEDLNISGMVKNHSLAGAISDASWSEFVRQLKYKAEWNGKNVLQVPRFEPSTKICSACGVKNNLLTLADREWFCASCGTLHDRDVNAAINIKNYCLKNRGGVRHGKSVELPVSQGAMKQKSVLLYTNTKCTKG